MIRLTLIICLVLAAGAGVATLVVSKSDNALDTQLAPGHWERRAFMYRYQDWLLSHRLDVQCEVVPENDTRALIVGPDVNRVFMRQFLRIDGFTNNMRRLGFQKITSWSGKAADPAR